MDSSELFPAAALILMIVILGSFAWGQADHLRWDRRNRREGVRVPGRVTGSRLARARNNESASRAYFTISFTTRDGREITVEDELPGITPVTDRPDVTVLYHPSRPDRPTVIGPAGIPSSRPRLIAVAVSIPFLLILLTALTLLIVL